MPLTWKIFKVLIRFVFLFCFELVSSYDCISSKVILKLDRWWVKISLISLHWKQTQLCVWCCLQWNRTSPGVFSAQLLVFTKLSRRAVQEDTALKGRPATVLTFNIMTEQIVGSDRFCSFGMEMYRNNSETEPELWFYRQLRNKPFTSCSAGAGGGALSVSSVFPLWAVMRL